MADLLKILLLEDSVTDTEIVLRLLKKEKMQFESRWVIDRETYLLALDEFKPDLILADNSLPQFNATEALEILDQRSLHIPFILITGTVSEEFAVNIMKSGANDYILKDRLARLPAAIAAALKLSSTEKERQDTIEQLKANEKKYRTLVERVSDGFIALDLNWRFTYVNKKAEELFKKPYQYLVGKNIWTEYPEAFDKTFYKAYHLAMETQENIHLKEYSFAIDKWVETNIYPSLTGVSVYFRDITDQRKADEKLEASEKHFRYTLDNMLEGIQIHDFNWRYVYVNDTLVKFSKYSREEMIGHTLMEKYPGIDQTDLFKTLQQCMTERMTKHFETEFIFPDGTRADFELSIQPVPEGIFILSIDITQRKKAQENLRSLEQEIVEQKIQEQKKMARAIISAHENERSYIGRELHDNITQILAGSKMYLGSAGNKDAKLKETIKYPVELIDSAIREIQSLTRIMVTPQGDINLEELIQLLLDNLAEATSIQSVFVYNVPGKDIDNDLKLNIYRIIQEQVNNITKYAGSTKITVTIVADKQMIRILVADDGKGFDLAKKRKGIGISNMINRVESFNGKFAIESSPGNGCTIQIDIPC